MSLPPADPTIRPLSQLLADLKDSLKTETVSMADIIEGFHERGFGFLLMIFAFPMALPLPVPPGINILLASPLVILTAQQALGRHTIWMPARMKAKTFSARSFAGLIGTCIPWMQRLEKLTRPRMGFVTQGSFSNVIGFLGLLMALTVMVPVPLTNTVPSLGIALMAVGVLMRDGLAVLAGAVIGSLWVMMLVFVFVTFGAEGVDLVKDAIKSLL